MLGKLQVPLLVLSAGIAGGTDRYGADRVHRPQHNLPSWTPLVEERVLLSMNGDWIFPKTIDTGQYYEKHVTAFSQAKCCGTMMKAGNMSVTTLILFFSL